MFIKKKTATYAVEGRNHEANSETLTSKYIKK
jgi:hypothetical protein